WHGDVCLGTPGGKRWLDCFAFPISFISLNEDGYILFGTDITDIKQQNADLQQEVQRRGETINRIEGMLLNSEKMASLGVISAGIAHEINNPLAFVDANMRHITQHTDSMKRILERVYRHLPPEQLARLLDRAETPLREPRQLAAMLEDMPDLIDETRDGVGRIRKIVQDLKFFSSQRDQADEHVDLDHCINIALNLARHETRNRIQVICEGDDDAPAIHGSETQLSQVFLNLIMNAAQAMEGRGAIHIRRHTVDGCCHVSVRDDGPGIPDSVIESIFEPFFTTKPAGEGTGLGLAISQDIVRRHGGTISVSSIPGKGTTFSMVFPLQQARSHHA
ncbi:MAG: sensor histidine kinase, partial [Alcanivoracaceae bacterium]